MAASKPSLFRRVVIMNAPLSKGHKLPDPLGVYTRPFGMGKGAAADVYKLAYYGKGERGILGGMRRMRRLCQHTRASFYFPADSGCPTAFERPSYRTLYLAASII